jgi:hypothetical protein
MRVLMRSTNSRGDEMTTTHTYGNKRDYRKIDLIVAGAYRCSTTWARTLKEAVEKFREANPDEALSTVYAVYAERDWS